MSWACVMAARFIRSARRMPTPVERSYPRAPSIWPLRIGCVGGSGIVARPMSAASFRTASSNFSIWPAGVSCSPQSRPPTSSIQSTPPRAMNALSALRSAGSNVKGLLPAM